MGRQGRTSRALRRQGTASWREALDLASDGKVDQVNYFEKNVIVRKESDLASSGKPSLGSSTRRAAVRKERDTNGTAASTTGNTGKATRSYRVGEISTRRNVDNDEDPKLRE